MKIDFSMALKALAGDEIKDGKGETFTLRDAAVVALDAVSDEDRKLEGKEKYRRGALASRIYGAKDVDILPEARKQIAAINEQGHGKLPVCIAKTHLSLSHDAKLKGRPTGFTVLVRAVKVSAGAGFVYALAGDMRTMPGLPSVPAGTRVDIDENGKVVGLF